MHIEQSEIVEHDGLISVNTQVINSRENYYEVGREINYRVANSRTRSRARMFV